MFDETTEVLGLGKMFDVRDVANKAYGHAETLKSNPDGLTDEIVVQLNIMNAGLNNFLAGQYAAGEPETHEVSDWIDFAQQVGEGFERISDDDPTFIQEDFIEDALAEYAEEAGLFNNENIPDYVINSIDWSKVSNYLNTSGVFNEIFIDGVVYKNGVRLPVS